MNFITGFTLIFALAATIACSSKKIKEDPSANAMLPPTITNDALSFSEGSDSGKIAGLTTVHFEFDRAIVTKNELDLLKQDALWIKDHPDFKIQIEGHCDQRGSVEYNLALGDRRAKSVANILVEMGVPKSRLSTISYGEERPIAQGDSDEAYAKNRRAGFVPLKMESQPAQPLAVAH
jgi:peptidoglycan-associated lipoprotein